MLQGLIINFNHSIILEATSMGYGQEKGLCVYNHMHLLELQNLMCTTTDQYSESDDGEEVWNESQEEVDGDLEPPSVEAYESESSGQESILARWIVAFIGYVHAFHALSDGVAELVLNFFVILFGVLGQFSTLCFAIAQLLPKSLYKLECHLGSVRGRFKRYAVCRECQHIY